MSHKIELVAMPPEAVEKFLAEGIAHCLMFEITKDLLPEVVAQDAMLRYRSGQDWFWCLPRFFKNLSDGAIVGSACFKNSPDNGLVDIGYGILDSYGGKGFASAGIAAILNEAFNRPEVKGVTAETSVDNIASQRVLEKNGFKKTGTREDPEDGSLIVWKCMRKK
ncbi:MAG: GNAT family N-acetyltransferase [Planctomycetaceae bacterium]|nr:GNAT family N-acetyltransferase [Planctomycetaceae bacterium]